MESLTSSAEDDDDGVARDRDIRREESPDRVGTGRARLTFCQAVRGLTYMPSLLSYLPSCPKCKLQMQNHWIPFFLFLVNYKNAKSKYNSKNIEIKKCWVKVE
jgi:hypothetical protein